MHRIGAELQGKHDGRVRGAQGHVLLMSGGLVVYDRPDASDPWCEFTAEGAIDPSGMRPIGLDVDFSKYFKKFVMLAKKKKFLKKIHAS